ncbi:toll/interleukin-1 receptor domain-containing protein [Microbacterium sp. H1-D42]|uniref:toll/interleukin-1 receptor domain-containing protein n=1 Tax=Microbacterium sp. H1-D42 TaxID=2925844 RepID=UPI001F536A9F|nr:toll/interleukin-1 receptor domain-containing protein [Microbacterium sp. H1-D42]UNK71727.1 toll/interleukin-1 receptor domain-containing protein [Microbacterium sp. H1-D42]
MKVFISWSGPRSQKLADALREWLHDVIQSVECFCSTEDIRAGQRWNNEVNSWLGETDFGVLCVTSENVKAPWLNFEAGALAKRINDDARVVPVTLGFAPSALDEPLKQFNGVPAKKDGILRLVKSIAEVAGSKVDIDRAFALWWPDLEKRISAIPDSDEKVSQPEPPDVNEMFTDIMSSIRGLSTDVRHNYPGDRVPLAEYTAMAVILAENDKLRADVASGVSGAVRYLREHARDEMRHRNHTARQNRQDRARREFKLEELAAEAELDAAMAAQDETEDTER